MNNTHEPSGQDSRAGDRVHRDGGDEPQSGSRRGQSETYGFDRDRAEQEAREAISDARDELRTLLENQKRAAAGQVQAIAEALRHTEDRLRDQQQHSVAAYVGHVANRIDYWSGRLRERHIAALGRDIQNVASRQPGAFIAGAMIVGFAAVRFLKSTQTTAKAQTASSFAHSTPRDTTSGPARSRNEPTQGPPTSASASGAARAHTIPGPASPDASQSRKGTS